jgi:hypothetical protein
MQFGFCGDSEHGAVVWWATAVAACFGTEAQGMIVFLVAIFLCQIEFGIYCVIAD